MDKNPFSGLLTSKSQKESENTTRGNPGNMMATRVNNLIEKVLLVTLNKSPPRGRKLVFLEELAERETVLSAELVSLALFERLLLSNPGDFLVPTDGEEGDCGSVAENEVFLYLCECLQRSECTRDDNDSVTIEICDKISEAIIQNASTAFRQPDLYSGQNLSDQLTRMFSSPTSDIQIEAKFLGLVAKEVVSSETEEEGMAMLKKVIYPFLQDIRQKVSRASLVSLDVWILPTLGAFVSDKTNTVMGNLLLDFTTPQKTPVSGVAFAESLLGQLLSLSLAPKRDEGQFEYYDNPTEAPSSNLTSSLWSCLKSLQDELHVIFKGFLVMGGSVRAKALTWIGDCLHVNFRRGQIWNAHAMPLLSGERNASDAFTIGLASVLLRLCQPLLKPQLKVLLVDPTYACVPEDQRASRDVHMQSVDKETCLLPTAEGETRPMAQKYNFITECFFMAHKAIDLGYRVVIEKIMRLNRDIHRIQAAYQDQAGGGNMDAAVNILQTLTLQSQKYFCLQNLILEPTNDGLLMQFYEATAIWLGQIVVASDKSSVSASYAPQTIQEVILPIDCPPSPLLKCIPEFVVENVVEFLTFIRIFDAQRTESHPEARNEIFTMILMFMGSSERVKNPHLRARLAEGLECLLPKENQAIFHTNLFHTHQHRLELIPNLLRVFVGIEMTGENVQFEQKFNYRRPMYVIMEFAWRVEDHKERFKALAIEAEKNIEAVNPPLFLRFINLLINDAIFLLDESLNNLQQIRTLQAAQDAGDWNSLPANERQQNMANLQHLGMMARFDNILGRDTIKMLKLLTTEIKGIFCDRSMVDRVAAMLNYFLLNLVGPKKGNFKVKHKKEFEFDPANTVLQICQIYANLQECQAFCLAVSQDGRSYSHKLFEYAEQVLIRIGGGQLIGEIQEFAAKVQRIDQQHKEDQEALADVPDEFLDTLMLTLMTDPVILPSSRVRVDRPTIARHLLSDQTDPFNRSPLTMDQVVPDEELKRRVHEWIKERREAYKAEPKDA
ncbi:ubiquitin conjugation factor E4 A [Phlebotomus argentipes]|uniref:ubiquitin conjugation factor E4 A n=1 Tax=Phlebotomus argentipes TaxID=94469 RepID=UPI00289301D1|nr:ubiquitin conjugation factor E4 A [Phlebotomus argentipes]